MLQLNCSMSDRVHSFVMIHNFIFEELDCLFATHYDESLSKHQQIGLCAAAHQVHYQILLAAEG